MTTFPRMTIDGIKPRPVSRRTAQSWDGRPSGRALVVTLAAGDLIQIREAGRRFMVEEPAAAVYAWAVKRWADREQKRKVAERKARKAAR